MTENLWSGFVVEGAPRWRGAPAQTTVRILRLTCYDSANMAIEPEGSARNALVDMRMDNVIWVLPSLLHRAVRMANHEGA